MLLPALCACAPAPLAETTFIFGRVLDATTKLPIAGATLRYEDFPERVVQTTENGRFEFPSIVRWQIAALGTDLKPVHRLVIDAQHYYSTTTAIYSGDDTEKVIYLRPLAP